MTKTGASRLSRWGYRAESFIDRFRPARSSDDLMVDSYTGYATPEGVVVRGRVLTRRQLRATPLKPGLPTNLRAMVALFLTREVSDVEVVVEGIIGHSDEEGYFSIRVPVTDPETTFLNVSLPKYGYECQAPVVVPHPQARIGIISDIDDTILQTGAWSILRNLWTTLTGAVESRLIFADTAELIRLLQDGVNPVFYVSSSPWNLHSFLDAVFRHNEVPFGPKFLRDLGISETQFIKSSHGSHKGDAIDSIVAANPTLKFVLIGDTGQHDGKVYLDAIARHEGRIIEVCLRGAGPLDIIDEQWADEIRATGVAFYSGPTFEPLLTETR